MNKLKEQKNTGNRVRKFIKDWKAKSPVSRILDIITLMLIILIIIPPTRMYLKTQFTRLTMRPPSVSSNDENITLKPADYQFSLIDDKGRTINFDQLTNKVIFVNFWATWCPPCVAEMPDLQKLYDKYKDKIVFIFITNEKRSTADKFLQKHDLYIPVYQLVNNEVPGLFYSNTIPATFIISKNGQIVLSRKGAAKWNSKSVTNMLDALLEN